MNTSLSSSLSALRALETQQGVTANNLANLRTPGFKSRRAELQENVGGRVDVNSSPVNPETGMIAQTGFPLDFAIQGAGYFAVDMGNGNQALTRDGSFRLSPEGSVVTVSGHPVVGFPPVPPGSTGVSVSPTGAGSFRTPNGEVNFQLPLAQVPNPQGLENLGGNLLGITPASGAPQFGNPSSGGLGPIARGALELSNVDPLREMVNLLEVKGAYSASIKAIQTADEMAGEINNLIRRS